MSKEAPKVEYGSLLEMLYCLKEYSKLADKVHGSKEYLTKPVIIGSANSNYMIEY